MPAAKPSPYLLLANIGQLLTLRGSAVPRRGSALQEIGLIEDAAVLCSGGKIVAAGPQGHVLRDPWLQKRRSKIREFDCRRKVVTPGLIDAHTHPVFAAPRLMDFEKRIAGASYQEIAATGGGIRSSVTAVRSATREQLTRRVLAAFDAMLVHGTTTVEAKSGYGLTLKDELKSLEAIRDAEGHWPGTVVATLLAAHVVPPEYNGQEDEYVKLVCQQIIPAVARRKLAGFVDVFCEHGIFTVAQSERVFKAGREHGLGTRAHVCQFTPSSLESLLRHSPASFDHMDCVAPGDISLLARAGTVATLLPGANYFLGHKEFPDARRLIDAGVPVAIATDYNPGTSPTPSMPFAISLACTHMKMAPAEAMAAATINAACALGLQKSKGSIEPGKDADLAVFDCDDYRELAYWFAWNRCEQVFVGGIPVLGQGKIKSSPRSHGETP
ncbi:MAG TPA: imidazolonepropionase [Candidatus Saccharimonadales bacterium]|nr:imidazolonepropionase [Candidatus Saccharimonadales bacterium]